MALKNNPFDNAYKGSLIKRKSMFGKEAQTEEQNSQDLSRDSLENIQRISREAPLDGRNFRESLENIQRISREYPVAHLENIQRISREDLLPEVVPVSRVVGLQREALKLLFAIAQGAGSRHTPPVAIGLISGKLKTSTANTQNAIKELVKKKVLIRKSFQRGRGGWSVYEIEAATFAELDKDKVLESLDILQRFSREELGVHLEKLPCSSSSLILKETTTTQKVADKNDRNLIREVPIPSRLIALGLTQEQLARSPLDFDVLCESLEAYAYDLEQGLKPPVAPLRYLIGIVVKRGQPYVSEALLAAECKAIDGYLKRKSELEARATQQIELTDQINFEKWLNERSHEEMRAVVPETDIAKIGSRLYRAMLHDWYMNNERRRVAQIIDQSLEARANEGA